MTLTPLIATALFVVLVFSGRAFRQVWKAQAPGWQARAWIYGGIAAATLLVLAFLPMRA